MKYTCIKSGKKLVWNKGVSLAPATIDLSKDPRNSPETSFTELSRCQTKDISNAHVPENSPSNGFPRPGYALFQKPSVRILVVPLTLADSPFTAKDSSRLEAAMKRVADFYSKQSYGRFTMKYTILSSQLGIRDSRTIDDLQLGITNSGPMIDRTQSVTMLLSRWTPPSNIQDFDAVVIESGNSDKGFAGVAFPGQTFQTLGGRIERLTFEFGTQTGDASIIAHELGHTLFGFEDLYIQDPLSKAFSTNPIPAGNWDIMSTYIQEFESVGFYGWNRFLAGWLKESEVRCLWDQKTNTHFLTNLENPQGPKLTLINIQAGVTLAVELRPATNFNSGANIYRIDSRIGHGWGPIQFLRVLEKGNIAFEVDGVRITVIDSNKNGALIKIERLIPPTQDSELTSEDGRDPVPIPSTSPETPRDPNDLNGKSCSIVNEITRNSVGEFWCLSSPDGNLRWSQNNPPPGKP